VQNGLILNGKSQVIDDFTIYTSEYFNPYDRLTGRLNKTSNTYSIHWYDASWTDISQFRLKFNRFVRRIIGVKTIEKIKGLIVKNEN
jgi:hypothetical protein